VDGKTPKGFVECNEMLNVSTRPTALLVAQKNGDHRKLTMQLMPLSRLVKDKLGIDVQELTAELVQALGVKGKVGLLIAGVEKGGPTEQAKLQSGFLITGIEGQTTAYLMTAADILADKKKGERVRLTVLVPQRAGNRVGYRQGTVEVKVR
jgi:S1-C subfamily serine protease